MIKALKWFWNEWNRWTEIQAYAGLYGRGAILREEYLTKIEEIHRRYDRVRGE